MKSILALDLGTTTGWAARTVLPSGAVIESSGIWTLATDKELRQQTKFGNPRALDCRIIAFRDFMEGAVKSIPVDIIVFEDVEFSKFRMQTQLWASLRAVVWLTSGPYFPRGNSGKFEGYIRDVVPVATLKKFATGKGNAKKEDMEKAFKKRFPGRKFATDDEIDAVFVLEWTKQKYDVKHRRKR